MKRAVIIILAGMLACCALLAVFLFSGQPVDAASIGKIPTPQGFNREEAPEDSYTGFLRALPLKEKDARVHLYTGEEAPFQWLSAGVIDKLQLGEYEQCADVTMRLRADYFRKTRQYQRIRFTDLSGKDHVYAGGTTWWEYEKYLQDVYRYCNTTSVYQETLPRAIRDVQPGDVLVYRSRRKGSYGHAVLVADVARDAKGRVAILCVEGNTPAREMHIVRNLNSFRNPWFILGGNERIIRLSVSWFRRDELRYYPDDGSGDLAEDLARVAQD